jgi:hypothetical protein
MEHAYAIYHPYIHEDSDHVNRLHLPVELGDIFELPS